MRLLNFFFFFSPNETVNFFFFFFANEIVKILKCHSHIINIMLMMHVFPFSVSRKRSGKQRGATLRDYLRKLLLKKRQLLDKLHRL